MSWINWYEWARLVLTTVGTVPAVAFLLSTRPTQQLQPPLPLWITWWQSLAITVLLSSGAMASVEAIVEGRFVPSWWVLGAQIISYFGLGVIRYILLWWRIGHWRRHRWPDRSWL